MTRRSRVQIPPLQLLKAHRASTFSADFSFGNAPLRQYVCPQGPRKLGCGLVREEQLTLGVHLSGRLDEDRLRRPLEAGRPHDLLTLWIGQETLEVLL